MRHLVSFSEASERTVAGGKGFGLHRLSQWGLNVPPGLVLTSAAYTEMLSGIRATELLATGGETGGPPAVRAAIHDHRFNPELAEEIGLAWTRMSDEYGRDLRVSCRSSATAEDSAAASFAGQFATVLGVAGRDNVIDAVRRCWASAWSEEALAYRDAAGISHDDVSMAVVIQKMVRADSSGVAFSINPVTGEDSDVIINSNWGLGETVVSGLVSPDTFLVRKPDLEILMREISQTKTIKHVVSENGSIEEQFVSGIAAASSSLTDEQVKEVARLALTSEQKAGSPQDIEWAYEAGVLYVLQTRPITTV